MSPFSAVEFRSVTSGVVIGRLLGSDGDRTAFHETSFMSDGVLQVVNAAEFGPENALVYMAAPPSGDLIADDATAFHTAPPSVCCGFASAQQNVGDTTGDGLDDAVVIGAGAWLLDGESMMQVEGLRYAAELGDVPAGFAGGHSLRGLGDVTGDGLDDFSFGVGVGGASPEVDIFSGATLAPDIVVRSSDLDHSIFRSAARVESDGASASSAVAFLATREDDLPSDEVWLLTGPLCAGDFVVQDAAVRLEAPVEFSAEFIESNGDGSLLAAINGERIGEFVFARR